MNAGDRDRLLTYQTRSESEAGAGEYVVTWTAGGSVWAKVSEVTGRELVRAGQVDSETPAMVVCDWMASKDFSSTGRFVDSDSIVYRIVGVREVGRNEAREFRCIMDYDGGA